jgi:hypothetical protein
MELNISHDYYYVMHGVRVTQRIPLYCECCREFEAYMEEVKKMPGIMGQSKRDVSIYSCAPYYFVT